MPARLHHDRFAHAGAPPRRWLVLTHGIFGAGGNWRAIARKLNDARPDWGVVLVDLRQHGRSEAGDEPHTVAAAADDLRALIEELGEVHSIAGHSFGGKVVLATRPLVRVEQTWVLDASPAARPDAMADPNNTVVRVLQLLERLPGTWATRDDFVAAVVADGHAQAVAQWLAMNIVPDASGALAMRLQPDALRSLLSDYFACDLWESVWDPAPGAVEVVIAEHSDVFDVDARRRLEKTPSHVHVHRIAAGHWLHIEAPGQVVALLAAHLP